MAQIGFIGAGRMGRPMAQRLVKAGHAVTVLCRSDAAEDAARADGAEPTRSMAAVAKRADAVVTCLFSDEQVREVFLGEGGLLEAVEPGALVVSHTTGSPRLSESFEATLGEKGAFYVDAAVSGGPDDISAGEITLFVGANDQAWEKAEPILKAYGNPILRLGPVGTGMKVKLLNNATFGANIGILAVISELAKKLQLDEKALLTAVSHGSGSSYVLGAVARGGSVKGFSETTAEFVDKDVITASTLLAELGAGLDDLAPLYQAMRDIRDPHFKK